MMTPRNVECTTYTLLVAVIAVDLRINLVYDTITKRQLTIICTIQCNV